MSDLSDVVQVRLSGPIFDSRAPRIVNQMVEECQRVVADATEERWYRYMEQSFQNPTGYYQSHVNIARRGLDLVVNDMGVVYNYWLERGSKNRNSAFQGYHMQRRTLLDMDRLVPSICRPIVNRAVQEMNHG